MSVSEDKEDVKRSRETDFIELESEHVMLCGRIDSILNLRKNKRKTQNIKISNFKVWKMLTEIWEKFRKVFHIFSEVKLKKLIVVGDSMSMAEMKWKKHEMFRPKIRNYLMLMPITLTWRTWRCSWHFKLILFVIGLIWKQHSNFAPTVEEEADRACPHHQHEHNNSYLDSPYLWK